MKTYKVLSLALIGSAALAIPVQAGPRHANGGSQVAPGPGRAAAYRSGPRYYSGGRMMAPSQRFSSIGMRSSPTAFQRRSINSNASLNARRITPGTFNRGNNLARSGNNFGNRGGAIGNSNRRAGVNNHVFARHTADWHRDWDRHSDHWWHGHRCRFVNGSWFLFDLGFYPWYGYPYGYYADDYYYGDPYGYDPGTYQETEPNYDRNDSKDSNSSSNQNGDPSIAAAQERLSRQGYYHGQIDGVFGEETRRAVRRFQSEHGLRETGYLTADTRQAMGLRQAQGN